MKTVNIHEAKTNLSKLIEQAVAGDAFIVAKAGKPMVKVSRLEVRTPQRIGFLEGQGHVPDDFDDMAAEEIRALFDGGA
ncbi:type II toxin-antitoxin system prevent-host-death family antitoxin [uncultured Roseobacter sp.]|uniref:type II toxin-antitoxin system Phd/YefM family antitoxin n=1 Tax=uncultured Roseobacter sp. TaxID=114847 RepID=UPI002639EF3A|nr:type II toxin-antitoxin system prevent-host-death family antitoxin [uncultured Roseobacter sp.]